MFVRNAWYVAAWDHEIGRDMLRRIILNEPVLLYRRQDGTPVALEDRCCHRQAPLSMGRLIGDVVKCPYHGLEFGLYSFLLMLFFYTLLPALRSDVRPSTTRVVAAGLVGGVLFGTRPESLLMAPLVCGALAIFSRHRRIVRTLGLLAMAWLPTKGSGLTKEDWPDIAIGTMPHVYPWILDNFVREGTAEMVRC